MWSTANSRLYGQRPPKFRRWHETGAWRRHGAGSNVAGRGRLRVTRVLGHGSGAEAAGYEVQTFKNGIMDEWTPTSTTEICDFSDYVTHDTARWTSNGGTRRGHEVRQWIQVTRAVGQGNGVEAAGYQVLTVQLRLWPVASHIKHRKVAQHGGA